MPAKDFFNWKLPALLWCLIIMILTSYPKLHVPGETLSFMDKLAHMFVYFILALLVIRGFVRDTGKVSFSKARNTFYLTSGIAVFDELHQIPIPGRSGDVFDAMADILGILLALGVFLLINKVSLNRKLAVSKRGDV